MDKKILIDASQPEETRVVVSNGSHIDEFHFESRLRKPIRGNIYLAKVVRVEPSLQAAFVAYGEDRHGFLAFNDIHPDYYQIPREDREALLAEQAEEQARAEARERAEFGEESESDAAEAVSDADESGDAGESEETRDALAEDSAGEESGDGDSDGSAEAEADGSADGDGEGSAEESASGGGNAEGERKEAPHRGSRRPSFRSLQRRYRLQEVIKNRQILLVQVVKEERGNKGAALTTYLSLAGRYCVLMPNTERGSGISRKITHGTQRKNLRAILKTLELPKGMGLIVRTAGAKRTKTDIRRDYEYLLRMWENVRDMTLKSAAPFLIYEEGDLIKRAIRDLYGKGVSEVVVEGDAGYQDARAFMRVLTPSHVKNVRLHDDKTPIFRRYNVEEALGGLLRPEVRLKSGGSLVIEQTEALAAIDVNSGKATREHNIESTALKTNLEATEEAARQMRLRDLSGLIVIDYIDMVENKNRRAVESRLKECLKSDRARYQVGSISEFGLLELSRQRMRTGILEGSSRVCPHCRGLGKEMSAEAAALRLLRAIRAEALEAQSGVLVARAPRAVAFYILNHKRGALREVEEASGVGVRVEENAEALMDEFALERVAGAGKRAAASAGGELSYGADMEAGEAEVSGGKEREGSGGKGRSRRSRGGRSRGRGAEKSNGAAVADEESGGESSADEASASADGAASDEAPASASEGGRSRRSRSSRGRRRRGGGAAAGEATGEASGEADGEAASAPSESADAEPSASVPAVAEPSAVPAVGEPSALEDAAA